ncbi:hypothetical protein NDU88_005686 [Pleurodeles waltl]|uniref:Uncharacterized protein n=1 Tax=Pleurodeles waltl TaxID=8319 RepID=A0AAV7QFF8_PLEWA|nr:hypothetical protein NDU88_005686 [Pleurodeles waltl]
MKSFEVLRPYYEVPKLRPIDSTRIPSAVKSRKCDVSRAIYTDVKEGTSLDTRYHGGGLMELSRVSLARDKLPDTPWLLMEQEIPAENPSCFHIRLNGLSTCHIH